MHLFRFIAFNKIRCPSITFEQLFQFFMADAGQHGWVGYFVTIEMKDWQHSSIGDRIEKFVGMPCCCQRSCFRFAVADNACYNQSGIIKDCSESMAE